MIKVLHVVWDLGQGGAQTYLRDLIDCHRKTGEVEAKILTLQAKGAVADEIEQSGIPVECVGLKEGKGLGVIPELYQTLRRSNYDILHSHSHNWLFNALLWKKKKPSIFTEHGGSLLDGRWQVRLFYKLFYRNYATYVAISKEMATVMRAVQPAIASRIVVVPNGVDFALINALELKPIPPLPLGIVQANRRVGIIGRLVPHKGIETFIDVASELARARENIVFPIVGDGPLRAALEAKVKRQGLEERIFFLGYRPDAKHILRLFDVFLFTSEYEAFGLVLTEAMASRVPVVALNLKGAVAVKEIIEDGVSGLIVDRKDSKALAACTLNILKDKNLRDHLVENARHKVEKCFSIEKNAKEILGLYKDLVAKEG